MQANDQRYDKRYAQQHGIMQSVEPVLENAIKTESNPPMHLTPNSPNGITSEGGQHENALKGAQVSGHVTKVPDGDGVNW